MKPTFKWLNWLTVLLAALLPTAAVLGWAGVAAYRYLVRDDAAMLQWLTHRVQLPWVLVVAVVVALVPWYVLLVISMQRDRAAKR